MLLGILAALLVAVPALAAPSPAITAKKAEAQRVLGEIDQLDESLGRANERLNLANLKLEHVQSQIKENRHELRVAKHNLSRSQQTVAQRLVTLYTKGETSPLEVILGARSLVEVLNRIDTEDRVSTLDAEVVGEVKIYKADVKRHARELRAQKRQARQLVAQRASEQRSAQAQLARRQQLYSSLTSEIQRMLAEQQARELQQARAARSVFVAAQARQSQSAGVDVFGATAATPEGATVVPSSAYQGAAGVALSYIGTPYVWAGAAPGGFDCSGLVTYAFSRLGVSLPHSSYALWNVGVPVSSSQLESGDLVFFHGLGHVGIYIGGGQFVHAPHTGDFVKVSSMNDGSYASSFVGARRVT
jgi:cell wall-associated NlpC family hydrolase